MRMLMKVQLPTDAGNQAIQDGTLPDIIRKTLETAQAEAAYFTTMDGERTMLAVFDLKAASDIVRIAEPLFNGLDALVDFMPCMNAEDLKAGLSGLSGTLGGARARRPVNTEDLKTGLSGIE